MCLCTFECVRRAAWPVLAKKTCPLPLGAGDQCRNPATQCACALLNVCVGQRGLSLQKKLALFLLGRAISVRTLQLNVLVHF